MPEFTVATITAEWMNDWFTSDGDGSPAWRPTFVRDGVGCDTEKAAGLLAGLITELDADVVAMQEAAQPLRGTGAVPGHPLADGGRSRYGFVHGGDGGAQKLALLVAPPVTASLVPASALGDLLDPWLADVDGDAVVDEYQFTRNPLVCRVELDGHPVEVIGAHLKSNFINQGERMWNDPARRLEFVRSALRNRRRIASEGMRTRLYLDRRPRRRARCGHGGARRPQRRAGVRRLRDRRAGQAATARPHHRLTGGGRRRGAVRKVAGSGRIEHDAWAKHRTGDGARRDERATDQPPCGCRPSGSAVGQTRA